MSRPATVAPSQTCLTCRPVTVHDPEDWDSIKAAFADAEACNFRQHWKEHPHPRFSPGTVRTGYEGQALWILAEFEDVDIFNTAVELNEHAYQLGDVFEIFLRALPAEEYIEFHVTPENQRLQLWWPRTRRSLFDDGWTPRHLTEPHFESWTQVDRDENYWRVVVSIPFDKLNASTPKDGHEWTFSFGRYDYTRGKRRPVLSSTSPHTRRDFHRHSEWGRLLFRNEKSSVAS